MPRMWIFNSGSRLVRADRRQDALEHLIQRAHAIHGGELALLTVVADHRRRLLVVHRQPLAHGYIAACKLIVLQLEIDIETVYYAIEFGTKHGIPVLLNPAPADPNLDLDRVKDCTYLMPNETELALLTGMPVESEEEIEAAARKLLDAGIKDVIVTLGSRGALWVNGEAAKRYQGEKVDAVDTTGAGDAFIGCFSHVLVQTGDIDTAITIANRYAADSVTRRGTQTSFATAEEFGLEI